MISMATEKVTVTLHPATVAAAKECAAAEQVSLSAWLDRAARRGIGRQRAIEYARWAAVHLDVAAVDELDEATRAMALTPQTAW